MSLDADVDTGSSKLNRMTNKAIELLSKKNKLYVTPHLNDVLYLHYQGYDKIECLEEYTGLKCLWLECNAFTEISGLEKQTELRCLYLQNNLIKKIEKLDNCHRLDTLNLSHNYINKIENCGSDILPELNTLNLSHNSLKSLESVEKLVDCQMVSVLDLSYNRINDILIVKVLADMPELRVLVLTGNPVVNDIPSYRKALINECKGLTYLDQRPVTARDRACAEAWKRGGYEEEKRVLAKWNRTERRKVMNSVRATIAFRRGVTQEELKLLSSSDDEQDDDYESKLRDVMKGNNYFDCVRKETQYSCLDNEPVTDISDCGSGGTQNETAIEHFKDSNSLIENDTRQGVVTSQSNTSDSAELKVSHHNDNHKLPPRKHLDIASNENVLSILQIINQEAEHNVPRNYIASIEELPTTNANNKLIEIMDKDDEVDNYIPSSAECISELPDSNDCLSNGGDNAIMHSKLNNNDYGQFEEYGGQSMSMSSCDSELSYCGNTEDAVASHEPVTEDNNDNCASEAVLKTEIRIASIEAEEDHSSEKVVKPTVTFYCTDLSNLREISSNDSNEAEADKDNNISGVSSEDDRSIESLL